VVESIYPAGGQRGTTVAVTAGGKLEPWPVKAWAGSPGLTIEPGKKAGQLTVSIAKDAEAGPHLVRLYNADGTSALRCLFVGDQPEAAEAEPNDELAKPQAVKALPVTINGQLDKSGDCDFYAVNLEAGQTLVASVQARRLGSALDPMLHLTDPGGVQVAFAHDGLGLDPLLAYRAPRAGTYVVRVSAFAFPPAGDVKLAGGKDAIYRLSLTTGAFVRGTYPMGARRGAKAGVRPLGWNLPGGSIELDATNASADVDRLFVPVAGGEARVRVEVGDGAEVLEPLGAATGRAPIGFAAPAGLNGVIGAAGEEDRYELTAKKGERWSIGVRAGAAGSPLEAVLSVRDAAGKVLASAGESGTPGDPKLDWAAPADGVYKVCVADLFGRGGGEFAYRVALIRPTPEVVATVENDAYALVPGKTTAVKVKVERKNGHAEKLMLATTGLPAGVTAAAAVEVPAKGGDVTVELKAAADAKAASGPIRFVLRAGDKDVGVAGVDLTKDADKAGGQGFIERTADVWLTVGANASAEKAKAK
jgi:hypothetical protein